MKKSLKLHKPNEKPPNGARIMFIRKGLDSHTQKEAYAIDIGYCIYNYIYSCSQTNKVFNLEDIIYWTKDRWSEEEWIN